MTINDILIWVGFAITVLLCVPLAGTRRLVLELTAFAVRLSLLALLAGGAFLWFRPALVPAEVVRAVTAVPGALDVLPSPEARTFGLATACLVAAGLIPCLAMLDVTRKLAGARLRRLRRLTETVVVDSAAAPVVAGAPLVPRRPDRRVAADAMARAGTRTGRG